MIMLKKSLSILCALSIITVLCLAVGCVKNNPPAITESISSSDTTAQSEDNESTLSLQQTLQPVPSAEHQAQKLIQRVPILLVLQFASETRR